MLIFKLWTRESRCRRFNIKLATIFPTIVYLKYILMVSALPLFMDRLVFTCCLTGRVKGDCGNESTTLIGWA